MIHRHHRKLRSQGGDDSPANILLVSSELHRYIHENPKESYERGWMVRSWQDPAGIGVEPHPELRFECRVCECGGLCDDCSRAA